MRSLLSFIALLPIVAGCATPSQMALDAEVRRLCAIDGGIRVYEQVKLPAEEFDKYSKRNWILPTWEQMTPTDNYYVERETHYYRKDSPEVARTVSRILRRSDGKVLGEYIRYGRGGGDLPGPWHGSYYLCPDPTESSGFETKIFIKGE